MRIMIHRLFLHVFIVHICLLYPYFRFYLKTFRLKPMNENEQVLIYEKKTESAQRIKIAFTQLIQQNTFDKITVAAIVKAAGINRAFLFTLRGQICSGRNLGRRSVIGSNPTNCSR